MCLEDDVSECQCWDQKDAEPYNKYTTNTTIN